MKNLMKKRWLVLLIIAVYTVIVIGITYLVTINTNLSSIVETSNTKEEITSVTGDNEIKEKEIQEQKEVTLNETVTEKDWEITIKEVGFKQDIIPSNPNSFYTHYQVKDTDNTYFYLIIEAKNVSSLGLRADSIAKVKMKYDNQYEYSTFSTIEESGGGSFTYTNITNIDPLTTRKIYYLVEVPKEIEEQNEKNIYSEITINNNTYKLNIR